MNYSPRRIIPQPKPGDRLQWRDLNLRSGGVDAILISINGEYATVKSRISARMEVTGQWLLRDLMPFGSHETNAYFDTDKRTVNARNDCLGLSWEQIETMQGGKLTK